MERPRDKGHGDYSTNVAHAAGQEGRAPTRGRSASCSPRPLREADGIAAVDVAGPGFLNVTVEAGAQGQVAADIVAAGAAYGTNDTQAGEKINVEFISANPTGPIHLGHTRWAVVGDAIGRVLEAAGADVTREFYINDRGNQMDLFAASIEAGALGEPVPDDGYQGDVHHRPRRHGRRRAPRARATSPPGERRGRSFREAGYALQLHEQQERSPGSTPTSTCGSPSAASTTATSWPGVEKLRGQGHLYDADGALWMRTTDFGDDQDRVLIRSNGAAAPTSPPTPPTTSTSASAASTAASTCSAPTTTATSVGSRRWRRAPATTPTATSRSSSASW